MKFAFVIFKYFPFGGVQRDMLRIARSCTRQGHAVTIYTGKWQGDPPPSGIEVVLLPPAGWLNHHRHQHFIHQVSERLRRDQPDLVLGFNRMPGLDAYFAADPCFEERARNEKGWLYRLSGRYRFFARCEREVMRADGQCRILLLAPREKALFQQWYQTPDARFIQLPPSIPTAAFAGIDSECARRSLRGEFGFQPDDLVMLFVGSAFVRKGLDRAMRGLAALPAPLLGRVRLLAVGQDDDAAMMRKLAEKLGVAERVVITQGRSDVPSLMKGADVLVHPARSELAGNVLIEAMTAGLPVLTSAECGYAMHVAEAGAGYVVASPYRQAEFDQCLSEILAARDRASWSDAGLAYTEAICKATPDSYEADLLVKLALAKAGRQ